MEVRNKGNKESKEYISQGKKPLDVIPIGIASIIVITVAAMTGVVMDLW